MPVNDAALRGVKAKSVHINPKMLEIMDQMKGERILKIGDYPIVANPKVPMDRFWVEKPSVPERAVRQDDFLALQEARGRRL